MNQVAPTATYDSLYLIKSLNVYVDQTTLPELHVFAYLSCLLALYDGRPVSEWGYEFVATESTSPFSRDLFDSTQSLVSSGLLRADIDSFELTDDGVTELKQWRRLQRFSERTVYLRGATGAASALPVNAVAQGLAQEPQIYLAGVLNSPRPLLDDAGRAALYEHFNALESALGRTASDLMVPAIIWITYLLEDSPSDVLVDGGDNGS
jgi:hypothetical protein